MKKIVLTYGLIAGLVVSAFMTTSMLIVANNRSMEMDGTSMIVGYLSMLIAFALIFVAVKTYRDKHLNGQISFGTAFKLGVLIALIASTLYVISWALVYNLALPDFMDRYAEAMMQQASKTASAAELQEKAAQMERNKQMYRNPLYFTLFTFAEILPVGLLVALIAALILKRKKKAEVAVA